MHKLAKLDQQYVWHPFTQMRDWLKEEPLVITEAKGALLRDVHGHEYLDGNSSIWTNLHGHNHPRINRAIIGQLGRIAHSSALGFANGPASELAEQLIQVTRIPRSAKGLKNPHLAKVFYSDDGSTALEVALKLSYESTRRTRPGIRPNILGIDGAYHGDTVGAVSLGHIDLFHKAYSGLLFKSPKAMAPYCYRCPFNRAKPERADARTYRKCNWECVGKVESAFDAAARKKKPITGFVYEPLMQGAGGCLPQPAGWLQRVCRIARQHGAQLIADEVMTAFGRCNSDSAKLFASHQEGVQPDYLCVAKGLTGGYVPMAATLTTQRVFNSFLGDYSDFKSFFHGHSFTGNQIGAAASLASLKILNGRQSTSSRQRIQRTLHSETKRLWELPQIGDIRQVGNVVGIELVRDWKTRQPFALGEKSGIRVCQAMAERGVLTRPIGNVLVLMPPYCTTNRQLKRMIEAVYDSVATELPLPPA
jgi:adenosylmethionine---8-amino-7-oxononanoate aminotransferase